MNNKYCSNELARLTQGGFKCSQCGIGIINWSGVAFDKKNNKMLTYDYDFKYCPCCGAEIVESEAEKTLNDFTNWIEYRKEKEILRLTKRREEIYKSYTREFKKFKRACHEAKVYLQNEEINEIKQEDE